MGIFTALAISTFLAFACSLISIRVFGCKSGFRFWVASVFAVPLALIGAGLYILMSVDTSVCSLPGDPYDCLNYDPGPRSFAQAATIGFVLPILYVFVAAPVAWVTRKWLGQR